MLRSSLAKRIKELEQGFDRQNHQHIVFGHDKTLIYSPDKSKIYIPSETGKLFEQSDAFVNLVIGPYGSGKTTMCLQRLVKAACNMPYWHNGRRKARALIIRNTSGELYSTTLQSWLSWFSDLGDIYKRQKPILTYEHHFNDGKGIVELELLFLALDREDDIRKMKSLEVTFAYINELSEVPQGVLSHLKGRLNGRYPSKQFCSEHYWSGIFADTNPPDTDHWLYKTFELECPDNYKIFHQPPGLIRDSNDNWVQNPYCDNYANLSNNYYTMLAEGQSKDFVKVYCLGEYGTVGFGKVVYPEFRADIHAREKVEPMQGKPIYVGWDGGLTPACLVVQFTPRGQLLILKEYTAEDMGIRAFAQNVVLPGLQKDFPYNPKIGLSRADPSGVKRDEIMAEFSFIGELNALGIETLPASTNDPDTRINSVRFFLNRMVDGQPALLIDKNKCPITFKGFVKGYVCKRVAVAGEERYHSKPDKNMYSHPHDALQYIALEFASDRIANDKGKKERVNMFNPGFRFG